MFFQMLVQLLNLLGKCIHKSGREKEKLISVLCRSAKKGLAINSSGIFMVICIPSSKLKEINGTMDSENWSTSPYNLEYLSMHLINIGMENIELIMKANRCKFDDPITGRECRISLNTGLVYERDNLILEYFKLDKRVKSLAAAVMHFTGRHHLHKSKYVK